MKTKKMLKISVPVILILFGAAAILFTFGAPEPVKYPLPVYNVASEPGLPVIVEGEEPAVVILDKEVKNISIYNMLGQSVYSHPLPNAKFISELALFDYDKIFCSYINNDNNAYIASLGEIGEFPVGALGGYFRYVSPPFMDEVDDDNLPDGFILALWRKNDPEDEQGNISEDTIYTTKIYTYLSSQDQNPNDDAINFTEYDLNEEITEAMVKGLMDKDIPPISPLVIAEIPQGSKVIPILVGHWTMDNDFNDKSGNGNNLNNINEVGLVEGYIGNAAKFDADAILNADGTPKEGSYFMIPPEQKTGLDISKYLTVSAWIYIDDIKKGHFTVASMPGNYQFIIRQQDGKMASWSLLDQASVLGNTVLEEGQWYHVAFVRQNGIPYFYLNGQPDGNGEAPQGYEVNQNVPFYMGHNGGTHYSHGKIDNVKIYNKALSADEILVSYNENVALHNAGVVEETEFPPILGKGIYFAIHLGPDCSKLCGISTYKEVSNEVKVGLIGKIEGKNFGIPAAHGDSVLVLDGEVISNGLPVFKLLRVKGGEIDSECSVEPSIFILSNIFTANTDFDYNVIKSGEAIVADELYNTGETDGEGNPIMLPVVFGLWHLEASGDWVTDSIILSGFKLGSIDYLENSAKMFFTAEEDIIDTTYLRLVRGKVKVDDAINDYYLFGTKGLTFNGVNTEISSAIIPPGVEPLTGETCRGIATGTDAEGNVIMAYVTNFGMLVIDKPEVELPPVVIPPTPPKITSFEIKPKCGSSNDDYTKFDEVNLETTIEGGEGDIQMMVGKDNNFTEKVLMYYPDLNMYALEIPKWMPYESVKTFLLYPDTDGEKTLWVKVRKEVSGEMIESDAVSDTITLDTDKPEIVITSPTLVSQDLANVYEPEITIEGICDDLYPDPDNFKVSAGLSNPVINDYGMDEDGNFEIKVTLQEGYSEVIIEAFDMAGNVNVSTKVLTLFYEELPDLKVSEAFLSNNRVYVQIMNDSQFPADKTFYVHCYLMESYEGRKGTTYKYLPYRPVRKISYGLPPMEKKYLVFTFTATAIAKADAFKIKVDTYNNVKEKDEGNNVYWLYN